MTKCKTIYQAQTVNHLKEIIQSPTLFSAFAHQIKPDKKLPTSLDQKFSYEDL